MYGVWFCLNLFESTMAAVLRPDPKNQIPSRDEREKAEWNGSNPCWLMLVAVGRCWLCCFVVRLHDFSRSGLRKFQPLCHWTSLDHFGLKVVRDVLKPPVHR